MTKINEYAEYLNVNEEINTWLNTSGKKAISRKEVTEEALEHVLDFFVSPKGPKKLRRLSVKDALRLSKVWSESKQKKGAKLVDGKNDIELVHDFLDGNKIVLLKTTKALQREGFLMSHCVGSYDVSNADRFIYSYRDRKNMPHATFEIGKDGGEIIQIKGKGNGPIHPKYIHTIIQFLKIVGINIRPNEMKNLGYYAISDKDLNYIKLYTNLKNFYTAIGGVKYAHD